MDYNSLRMLSCFEQYIGRRAVLTPSPPTASVDAQMAALLRTNTHLLAGRYFATVTAGSVSLPVTFLQNGGRVQDTAGLEPGDYARAESVVCEAAKSAALIKLCLPKSLKMSSSELDGLTVLLTTLTRIVSENLRMKIENE